MLDSVRPQAAAKGFPEGSGSFWRNSKCKIVYEGSELEKAR